jgi:uncharacterized protein YjbJ (UPF0337 family)
VSDDLKRDSVENRVKGAGKEVEGKIQSAVGGATGDVSEQFKGKAKELRGKIQRRVGESQADYDRRLREAERIGDRRDDL